MSFRSHSDSLGFYPASVPMTIPRPVLAGLLSLILLPSPLPAAEKPAARDSRALALLQRMSQTLAAAPAFTYDATSMVEVPARTGQFLTLFSRADVALKRPDKLRAFFRGEAPAFDFFYNGRTVTAFAPATKVYSVTKAPATIDAMLPGLEEKTGVRFATAPLLVSDPYRALTTGLTSAVVVGTTTVRGVSCQHLALRSTGVNWEIWIESGSRALPRRLAVTFTDRTGFPRTVVEFSRWNLNPWLRESDFEFRKPSGATEIPYQAVLKSAGR